MLCPVCPVCAACPVRLLDGEMFTAPLLCPAMSWPPSDIPGIAVMPDMPETLAFTLRQSLVGTDNAGREKSWSTPMGGGPAGASGAAGSSAVVTPLWPSCAGGAVDSVAWVALLAVANHAPHSDSATGTIHARRRIGRNVIERLVKLATPRVHRESAGSLALHVQLADGLMARATDVGKPVAKQRGESVQRGTETVGSRAGQAGRQETPLSPTGRCGTVRRRGLSEDARARQRRRWWPTCAGRGWRWTAERPAREWRHLAGVRCTRRRRRMRSNWRDDYAYCPTTRDPAMRPDAPSAVT